MKKYLLFISLFFLFFLIQSSFAQQNLSPIRESLKASVTQRVGLTDITITYHRPAVKEREVWGKIVPYNQVWRAGANENTTISFTDPVTIGGKELPAGTYGLHMIPTENEWTIILSNNSWSWGSFFYKENEDAHRFTVKPGSADHEEFLEYTFELNSPKQLTAILHWEKLQVPITIDIDVPNVVLSRYQKELDFMPGFFWQGWNQAANYALQNNVRLDDAMQWVDKSIAINKNFTNLLTKSGLMKVKGNTDEAEKLMAEAVTLATEAEMNNYGYQLLNAKKYDEAIAVFKKNIEDHPESWNTYDSLGEAYAITNEKDLAVEYYTKALNMVQDDTNKNRITNILAGLNGSSSASN